MKIQSVQNYNYASRKQSQQTSTNSIQSNAINKIANSAPSFGIGAISGAIARDAKNRLNILGRSASEMVDLAESLHLCPTNTLKRLAECYDDSGWFSKLDQRQTSIAETKLINAVNEVLERKAKATPSEVESLNQKADEAYEKYQLWTRGIGKDLNI